MGTIPLGFIGKKKKLKTDTTRAQNKQPPKKSYKHPKT
jgi:hypothetical protein